MLAYQYNLAGLYEGPTEADESPLEPGVYHLPARATLTPPPESWAEGEWPRFTGSGWQLINLPKPQPAQEPDPLEKLKAFLADNPDVADLIDPGL